MTKNPITTIDDLARMINEGFTTTATNDLEARMKKLEDALAV
jgi:hypothetical protein